MVKKVPKRKKTAKKAVKKAAPPPAPSPFAAMSDEEVVTDLQELLTKNRSGRLLPHAPAKEGEAHFTEIYNRYQRKIEFYCRRFIYDDGVLQDVYHDIFLKIYLNIHRYHYKKSFKAWVYKIAHNACINYIRKHRKGDLTSLNNFKLDEEGGPKHEYMEDHAADIPDIEKSVIKKEMKEAVEAALRKLPYPMVNVYSLKTVAQLSFEEIAKIEKISSRSVKTIYQNVLTHLRDSLESASFRPDDLHDR